MAKGRRHGEERLLGAPAHFGGGGGGTGHPGGGGGGGTDIADLSEDDVWPAFHAAADDGDPGRPTGSSRGLVDRHVSGGLSIAFEDACRGPAASSRPREEAASSAPVNVPVWPPSFRSDTGGPAAEREEEEWLPPHEYLARAQGKSTATSVFEGVGRTLKGRDMSRVREAVWSQTGFCG